MNFNPKEEAYRKHGIDLRGPWSGDSNLGQRMSMQKVEVVRSGAQNQYVQEYSSQTEQPAAFKMPDFGIPKVWTVTLYPDFNKVPGDEVSGQDVNFGLCATLKFGCGGAMQTVCVDIENGTTVSAPMNALEVRVDQDRQSVPNNSTLNNWDYLVPQDLGVIYTLAQGTALAHLARRTLVYYPRSNENSDVVDMTVLPIPNFASHVTVIPVYPLGTFPGTPPYDPFDAANQLLFFGSPNSAVPQPPVAYFAGDKLNLSDGVPIPSTARGIGFRNLSAADNGVIIKLRFTISI